MRSLIFSVCFLLAALATSSADNPGIIKGTDQFEFVYRVKLPEIKGNARVWIPLAKTDAFQTVSEQEVNIPLKWEKVHDRDYGNDICVLYPQAPDSGKTIELRYRVLRKEKNAYPANNAEGARYLRPETLVPVNETFRTLADKAAAGKTDDLDRAKAIYDHVIGRMRPVSRSARPFPRTKTRAQSTAIIAGRNFLPMDGGCRLISARLGKIQSWRIITLDIIRRTGSNLQRAAIWWLIRSRRAARSIFSSILCWR